MRPTLPLRCTMAILFLFLLTALGCDATFDPPAADSESTADPEEEGDAAVVGGGEDTLEAPCLALVCDDGNPCTDDSCDAATGKCVAVNVSERPCDDGNACTTDDVCDTNGVCVGDGSAVCEDDDVCTADSCDPESGCVFTVVPNGDLCNDGNACTEADTCEDGACAGIEKPCTDDDNSCTVPAGCDDATGECLIVEVPDGTLCDDGNACTSGDTCETGECVSGGATVCDDGNECTDDPCSPKGGCSFFPNTEFCDDGSLCTSNDQCLQGQCNGTILKCDDSNLCTNDGCDPASGCVNDPVAVPCDDDNPCTLDDACAEGLCVSGAPKTCDDGNACTDGYCELTTGDCAYATKEGACDDGSVCTTEDTCANGVCSGGSPLNCDDSIFCTTDGCDPVDGCFWENATGTLCDDGNPCTVQESCDAGQCAGGTPTVCNDNNDCTYDSCSPDSGCVYTNNTALCDDGNPCTTEDLCNEGSCLGGAPPDCDDGVACTNDTCNPASGCVYEANDAACDDDNACSDDSCDPDLGCVGTANTNDCTDNNACTVGDVCIAKACVPGAAPNCDDGNGCTDDSCDTTSGCVNAANSQPCDDEDACTLDDICVQGSCPGGAAAECDDGNACTDDSCDASSGCVNAANSEPCTDNDACTVGDICIAKECIVGAAPDCDDENGCTTDSCDPQTGCLNAPNTDSCDDGDACTTDDACVQAACVGGPTTYCNDNNVCTDDSCDSATGCVYADKSSDCDDGKPCTEDICHSETGCSNVPLCGGNSTENGEECSCEKNCDVFSGYTCCSDVCETCPCTAYIGGGMGCDIDWENPPACQSGQSIETYGQNCEDIQQQWLFEDPPDGVYWVIPDPWGGSGDGPDLADAYQVYCDMTTDGGGWTVAYFVDAQHWNPKLANDCDPSGTPPLGINGSSGVWNPIPSLLLGNDPPNEILVSCGESLSGSDHYWTFYRDWSGNPATFFDGIVGNGTSPENFCSWEPQGWNVDPANDGFDATYMYTDQMNTNTGKDVQLAGIDKSAGQLWLSTSGNEYSSDEEIVWGGGQVYPEYSNFSEIFYGVCDSAKQCNTTCEPYGFFNSPWDGGCVVYPICNGVQSNTARFKIAIR